MPKVIKGHASYSSLSKFLKMPFEEAVYQLENQQKKTKSLQLGSAVDVLFLSGEEAFYKEYAVGPCDDKKMTAWREWRSTPEAEGKILLKVSEWQQIEGMCKSLERIPWVQDLMKLTKVQHKLEFKIFDMNILSFVDIYAPGKCIVDLKTASDVSHRKFKYSIRDFKYDLQAYLYTEGIRRLTGEDLPFYWLVVGQKPNHAVKIYEADQDVFTKGKRGAQKAIELFWEWQTDSHNYDIEPEVMSLSSY